MNNINISFKIIYSLKIFIFLFFFILTDKTYSEEKIGSVVALKGEIIAINIDDEKRTLNLYDDIFLFDEIVTDNSSSITIQYYDSSTVIIKPTSSFSITDFAFSITKKKFLGIIKKGMAIIESGKIAKNPMGSMTIETPTMTLGVRGTRFNMKINSSGTTDVGLSEDSFGNVGTINISSGGIIKTLFDPNQVISVNIEKDISERPKTDDEKKELIDVSDDLIEASSIDENLVKKNLEEKLINGNLLDANGDGIINSSDIEIIKENIKIEKKEKIDFIINNSTGENTEFLSQVLNKSDEANIGSSIDKIFETNNDLVVSVINNLSTEDSVFLTTSNSETNNTIKEKIYTQMLNDNDNDNIDIIGKIILKSDNNTIEKMLNIVSSSSNNDTNSNLSLQVLSSVADANAAATTDPTASNISFLDTDGQNEVNKLIENAVANASSDPESAKMLANVITKGNQDSVGLVISNIQTISENNSDSNLSLQVLSSVADANAAATTDPTASNISFLDTDGQNEVNKLIENAVANASSDPESAKMLANVITKSDAATVNSMFNTIAIVSTNNQNFNLAAQVLSNVASTVAISNTNENSTTTNQVNNFINTITEITETIEAAAEYNSDGYNASQNYIETYNLIISGGGSP